MWKYYVAQGGNAAPLLGSSVNAQGIVPNLNASGSGMKDGQSLTYQLTSSDAANRPMLSFTSLTPQATVSGIITYDAATNLTHIVITSTTPIEAATP